MLRDWLAPDSVEAFVQEHLARSPLARPSAAEPVRRLLDWQVFGSLLGADPPPDVLVATRGLLVQTAAPRSLEEARRLMQQGFGIVVRQSERHSEDFAELARSFAEDLPGEVHVQLYATPAGTQTFGWHYDHEDVFIAQTVGIKDYYFRENTVSGLCARGQRPDFAAVRRETSQLLAAKLIPGDWLYIPRRWWHLVRSVEDALSISLGIVPELSPARSPELRRIMPDTGTSAA
jgi:ribosomal protein L16 Arg81 hydroxylase